MSRLTPQAYLGVPENWPVKENIKHQIVLLPSAEDIVTGEQGNPRNCALCKTIERTTGVIGHAAVGGRWAYIPQKDARGRFYIAKMQATAETQKALRKFDRTGKMPEVGFTFVPIAQSHTQEARRVYRKLVEQGKIVVRARKRPNGKLARHRLKLTRHIPRTLINSPRFDAKTGS